MVALTSTRILVRQGIVGRDTVQLRLQRITEVNIRQELIERVLGTGSLIIDVQGEDDSLTLEYMRKPAVVQRVINSQINEIVGGGRREAIPSDMQPRDRYGAPYADDTRRATTTRELDRTTTTRTTRPPSVSVGAQPGVTPGGGRAAPAGSAAPTRGGARRRAARRRSRTGHPAVRDTGPAH